jgi:S1-C subfamily serine protease
VRSGAGASIAAAVAVLLVGASVGCSSPPELDRARVAAATVRVRAQGCGPRTELGVGTAVDRGLVITAAHVVAGSNVIDLVDRTGTTARAEVVLFDPERDVAALRSANAGDGIVALRGSRADVGDRGVVALPSDDGSVELLDVEVVQRVTIRTTDIYREADVERPGLRIAVDVEPGDSGAMLHLSGGGAGIVWSRSLTTDGQAWTVDLPPELLDESTRRALTEAVDTGPCP